MVYFLGRNWSKRALLERVGHMDQLAGIKAMSGADGVEQGVRMLELYTGSGLRFRVLPDRALDITACSYQGISLAWASPSAETHPAYYEAEGMGWLRSFPGGLLTTCGLDHFGAPASDSGESFGIHGRISNLPAQQVNFRTFWQGDDYILEVSGKVRQARLFGENLLLERRISTALGSNKIMLEDTVSNEGFNAQPHMILYHCNLGFPLLAEDAILHLEAKETFARDTEAQKGLTDWQTFQKPTKGYLEQVFRHDPKTDKKGWVRVMLENPQLNLKLAISYDKSTLPQLFQWKMMGQGAYVLGLEPANSSAIGGRAVARDIDDLPQLKPGERRHYQLSFEVLGK